MAVEPNADHPLSNEVEEKILEEESSDEYDTEDEGDFAEGGDHYDEEEEEEEFDEAESGGHDGSSLTACLLGPGNGQNGYVVEGGDGEYSDDQDEDEEYQEEASGTADRPIVLESDSNSKSTSAGTKRGAEDLDAEDGKDSEGETVTKKTRV